MSQKEYPLNAWRQTPEGRFGTSLYDQVDKLGEAMQSVDDGLAVVEAWEAWLTIPDKPEPDVFAGIAAYGTVLLQVENWDEFPILPKSGDEDNWREWNLGANLHEFYSRTVAGVAGGLLELAGRDPETSIRMLQHRLQEKERRVRELIDKPIEWFTPADLTEEQRDEGEDLEDNARLEELFGLIDQLEGFQHGFPLLRTIALTSNSPDLGLPNKPLYEQMLKIDLNQLFGLLHEVTSKRRLQPIVRRLSDHGVPITLRAAPDAFWWRHWKTSKAKRRG